uniref:Glycogenin 1 n=1 Tax=Rhinopithecus roxellana TaxID=61622 RepID=A0A2K6PHF1_RHIRO
MKDQAFATLTTNDAYTKGVLHRTTKRLVVLAIPQVSDSMRKVLETVFAEVIMVDKRPELAIMLTKLHCWLLTQYSKCISMDADTLVLGNIDDLFERELSAGPDPRWPDCFNSKVFIYQPSFHLASEQGKTVHISWDSNHGIIFMIPKQKVSKCVPVIPTATWEAKAEESLEPRRQRFQ